MSHNVVQRSTIGARRHIRRVVAVVTAAAATGLGWAAGRLAHVDYVLQTPLGAHQITVVMVIAATAISGLAGWAVSSLLERHASDSVRAWITLALVVLTLSILPIFTLRASTDTRLALTALHCLAAAILTAGLPLSGVQKIVVVFSSTAASVIVTPSSMVRMIVSATTDGGQAVAFDMGHLGVLMGRV